MSLARISSTPATTTRVRRPHSPFGHKCRPRTESAVQERSRLITGGRSLTGGDMRGLLWGLKSGGVGGVGLLSCPQGRRKPPYGVRFHEFSYGLCCVRFVLRRPHPRY